MKKAFLLVVLLPMLTVQPLAAHAQSDSPSLVPRSGAYIGLGFGANSTQFGGQNLYAEGISTVTNTASGAVVNNGTAGGPAIPIGMSAVNSISPSLQAGYFEKFKDSSYLWGVKFSYSYMGGSTATNDGIRIPQYGNYSNGTPFTGNAIASSYQKTIQNQISLIPYFGQSFDRGTIYFGVGPTLSQSNTKINNLVGFADVNGARTDISGSPQNFSSTQWLWGAAATIGGTYFIDKSWFIDVSYTYSMTQNKTSNYYSTFNNPGSPNTYSGSLIGNSTGNAKIQTIGLTINKLF